MRHLDNWKYFNESNSEQNPILSEIVDRLSEVESLVDLYFGNNLTPSVYFILKSNPFTISLTDRIGMNGDYSTITVIVETNGITESLGYFNTDEIDGVVDSILNYSENFNEKKINTFNESEQDKFVLLQDIGKFRKGKTFDSFGGLVSGVVIDLGKGEEKTIKFYDKKWFKLK